MDDRATLGFWAGLVGATLAVVAALTGSAVVAVLAGVAALGAGGACLSVASALRQAGAQSTALEEQVARLRNELAAEREIHVTALESPLGDPGGSPGDPALNPALNPALTDPSTGLFNEEFFRVTLEARISAARRHLRPVAIVLLQVFNGVRDGQPEPADPSIVADGIRATLREADTACWLSNGRFAFVLEDTPENGAVWTVERVRRFLAAEHPEQTMWAGVACYPAHAFDADEILERADQALEAAREWRQDRIEVATSE